MSGRPYTEREARRVERECGIAPTNAPWPISARLLLLARPLLRRRSR